MGAAAKNQLAWTQFRTASAALCPSTAAAQHGTCCRAEAQGGVVGCPPFLRYLYMNDMPLGDNAHVFQVFLLQKQQSLSRDVVFLKQACVRAHLC